jgi:ADP-ribose pyrophosphatase
VPARDPALAVTADQAQFGASHFKEFAMSNDYTETMVSSRTAYEGKLLTLKEDRVSLPDGGTAMREYVLHQGASMVLPLFSDGSVLLERQFRYPLRRHFLELPAGKIDLGEDALTTAQRELLEETGYTAADWRHLITLYPCVGYSNERVELFIARGLKHEGHPGEDGEFIECVQLGLDEALELVTTGEINEPKTIVGLLWADKLRKREWK